MGYCIVRTVSLAVVVTALRVDSMAGTETVNELVGGMTNREVDFICVGRL